MLASRGDRSIIPYPGNPLLRFIRLRYQYSHYRYSCYLHDTDTVLTRDESIILLDEVFQRHTFILVQAAKAALDIRILAEGCNGTPKNIRSLEESI